MFAKKKNAPGKIRSQRQIKAATRKLIELANRTQTRSGETSEMEDTGPTEVELAQAIAEAQGDLVKAILIGCGCGVRSDEIFQDAIKPVLEDAVVGEVAREALSHALSCVAL